MRQRIDEDSSIAIVPVESKSLAPPPQYDQSIVDPTRSDADGLDFAAHRVVLGLAVETYAVRTFKGASGADMRPDAAYTDFAAVPQYGCLCCAGTGSGLGIADRSESSSSETADGETVTDFTSILSGWTWWGYPAVRGGAGMFLTYSFEDVYPENVYGDYGSTFVPFSTAARTAARAALEMWASVSGITFLEASSGGGDIRFVGVDLESGIAGRGSYPNVNFEWWNNQGVVWMDLLYTDDMHVLLHEIGHTLGLKHPHDATPMLDPALDTGTNSVMSYKNPRIEVLGPFDISAIQSMYGDASMDGTQVASWSWNSTAQILTQTGFGTADWIRGVASGNIIHAAGGNDTVAGGAGTDLLNGDDGADRLSGFEGNDTLNGGAGSDTLNGGENNDAASGGDGADVLSGDEGNDTLSGATGNDTLWGGDGKDVLQGGDGANYLSGDGGNDTITGGLDGDVLNGGSGVDSLRGGGGNDWYYVDAAGDIITEFTGEGTDSVSSTASYSLSAHIENFFLSGSDNINGTGNSLNNYISGNSGANGLDGGSGSDSLYGNEGNDTLTGGSGDDTLDGGLGRDVFVFGTGDGSDIIYNFVVGDDRIDVSGDNGFQAYTSITQDSFYARITFASGDFIRLYNITATTLSAANFIFQAQDDPLLVNGTSDNDTLTGGGSNDTLNGLAGNDSLSGLGGNDVLNGGTGIDTMIGGLGDDTYYIDNTGDRVSEANGEGTDTVVSTVTVSVAAWSIENVTLTGEAHIDITGNGLDNILTGNTGNNSLNGRGGADRMIGGLGNDTYYVDNVLDRVTETDGQGTDTIFSSVSFSVAAQAVENVTLTGSADIEAIGNSLSNILTGNGGANSLNGRVGADSLIGGAGHDIYYVDNLGDVVTELAGQGVDTIVTSLSYSLAGLFVEKLTLNGSAGNGATGNAFNNIIAGNNGNNLIDGGAGADRMYGALGNDTFIIDDVNDKPTEKAGEGYDTLMTSITFSVAAQNIEAIILTGSGHIDMVANPLDNVITGNSGNNVINGRSGHDTIDGGAGNDTLIGSTGNDILTGGLGADIFLFSKKPGTDTVTDFDKAEGDTINLNEITAGITTASIVTQSGSDVIIDFGGGHILTIQNAAQADVLTQIVW